MEKVFSDKTEEGIRLIWMQFDPEKTAEGVRLLREAADAGDPDALCFLARTYMGERYVWEYAALEINGEKAASLLKEGIRRGSACASRQSGCRRFRSPSGRAGRSAPNLRRWV